MKITQLYLLIIFQGDKLRKMAVAAARLFRDAIAGDYRRVKKFSREILKGCRGALEDIRATL